MYPSAAGLLKGIGFWLQKATKNRERKKRKIVSKNHRTFKIFHVFLKTAFKIKCMQLE
jgi:G:T-mismatch repair DNA endonuclease (very short patch repair protein)